MANHGLNIKYHQGNINVVLDTLGGRSVLENLTQQKKILIEMQRMKLKVILPEITIQFMEI